MTRAPASPLQNATQFSFDFVAVIKAVTRQERGLA
jgi:hypothetical protein